MSKLILIRHGQSLWNAENKFTGWVDVDLTDQGILEAKKAAELLKALDINSQGSLYPAGCQDEPGGAAGAPG